MVSEKKIKTVKEMKENIEKNAVIGMLDMFKLPSKQLMEIREKLRGKASIKMAKKSLIKLALKQASGRELGRLAEYMGTEPAILFSNTDSFKLAKIIGESKSVAPAKPGDIAPKDIVVRAGPTSLSAGPVIGELQRFKIPASVEGEKITIREETLVAKEGDRIDGKLSDILTKLGIEPMEIGLNLLAAAEGGVIYTKDVLFVPREEYVDGIKRAAAASLKLSVNINYITPNNIGLLISKARREAVCLATKANMPTQENLGALLSRANAQASALEALIKNSSKTGG